MAKKFLYIVAALIVLVIGGRIAYELFQDDLARIALVPSADFTPTAALKANAYEDTALWYSRPGIGASDPARWQPAFAADAPPPPPVEGDEGKPPFAVFFVHPTSYLSRSQWNAPVADPEASRIARIYLRGMASAFNGASEIWAPRYRQATMGAFLTEAPQGQQAIDAAYADVREAYRYFLSSVDPETPIILAGHSQGALHLLRLVAEEVKGTPAADRLVAAYVVGWPVSETHDLPAMGVPACATAAQTGCVLSWSSYAEPADPSAVLTAYAASRGLDGKQRGKSPILCTNPLTGTFGGSAPASANLGTLKPEDSMENGELVRGAVPARCDARGLLLIGSPPEMGSYVLPGNNYHVYDIPLFWENTRSDAIRRAAAWRQAAN